jgi:hypothetical protein
VKNTPGSSHRRRDTRWWRAGNSIGAEEPHVPKNITEVTKFGQSFIDNFLVENGTIWQGHRHRVLKVLSKVKFNQHTSI